MLTGIINLKCISLIIPQILNASISFHWMSTEETSTRSIMIAWLLYQQENCLSLEKLVIDNEYCGAAYRLIKGINVDDVALATEVITKVGPGGHLLAERHTRENLRRERFFPSDVLDRLSPDAWVKAGSFDSTFRARERASKILDEHEPTPLLEDAADALERALEKILGRYGIPLSSLSAI